MANCATILASGIAGRRVAWLTMVPLIVVCTLGCERVERLNDPLLPSQVYRPISPTAREGDSLAEARPRPAEAAGASRRAADSPADPFGPPAPAYADAPAPQATSVWTPATASPLDIRMQRITVAAALSAPQRTLAGVTVACARDDRGELVAIMQAVGQAKQVPVPGDADFYCLSHRPDVVIMHDRYCRWIDTIRVFTFSPGGVRERTFSHNARAAGYLVRQYSRFELAGRNVMVAEELSAGESGRPPQRRRFVLPVD